MNANQYELILETISDTFRDVPLNNWLRRAPAQLTEAHLGFETSSYEANPCREAGGIVASASRRQEMQLNS